MTRGSAFSRRQAVSAVGAVLATVVAAAAVAIPALTSGPTASASVFQSPGLTPGRTLSGVVVKGGAGPANAFASYRHAPVTAVVAYTSTDSWGSLTNIAGEQLTGYWSGINAHQVWSMPLIPSDGTSTLEAAASGAYDSKYAQVAQGLVATGGANVTIRLGWEMTGTWFAWSGVKDPAAFAGAFRHAVTAMRAVPGQHFTFDFTVATDHVDPTPMYPGDAYVDIIGADQYDVNWNFPAWDHSDAWNFDLNAPGGLNWLANFAAAHGKRISLPEWGLAYRCDGHGGGDDTYFIDQMRNWINNHDVAYEAYFESDDNSCQRFTLTSGIFPNAAADYIAKWSTASNTVTNPIAPIAPIAPAPPAAGAAPAPVGPAPVPVAPVAAPAPAAPAAPTTGLLLSYSSDRSAPVALDKAVVGRSAYIFYATPTPVRLVVFSLDGKPYRAETSAAYDLVGTDPNGAKPFLPSKLKAGQHTVSAVVTAADGTKSTVSATFTVPRSAIKTLTTRYLRLSSAALGRPTVRLDRAQLRGVGYLIFSRVSGEAKASYRLDGKLVRTGKAAPSGAIKVATLPTTGLSRGKHTLVLRLVSKAGRVTTVRAKFQIV